MITCINCRKQFDLAAASVIVICPHCDRNAHELEIIEPIPPTLLSSKSPPKLYSSQTHLAHIPHQEIDHYFLKNCFFCPTKIEREKNICAACWRFSEPLYWLFYGMNLTLKIHTNLQLLLEENLSPSGNKTVFNPIAIYFEYASKKIPNLETQYKKTFPAHQKIFSYLKFLMGQKGFTYFSDQCRSPTPITKQNIEESLKKIEKGYYCFEEMLATFPQRESLIQIKEIKRLLSQNQLLRSASGKVDHFTEPHKENVKNRAILFTGLISTKKVAEKLIGIDEDGQEFVFEPKDVYQNSGFSILNITRKKFVNQLERLQRDPNWLEISILLLAQIDRGIERGELKISSDLSCQMKILSYLDEMQKNTRLDYNTLLFYAKYCHKKSLYIWRKTADPRKLELVAAFKCPSDESYHTLLLDDPTHFNLLDVQFFPVPVKDESVYAEPDLRSIQFQYEEGIDFALRKKIKQQNASPPIKPFFRWMSIGHVNDSRSKTKNYVLSLKCSNLLKKISTSKFEARKFLGELNRGSFEHFFLNEVSFLDSPDFLKKTKMKLGILPAENVLESLELNINNYIMQHLDQAIILASTFLLNDYAIGIEHLAPYEKNLDFNQYGITFININLDPLYKTPELHYQIQAKIPIVSAHPSFVWLNLEYRVILVDSNWIEKDPILFLATDDPIIQKTLDKKSNHEDFFKNVQLIQEAVRRYCVLNIFRKNPNAILDQALEYVFSLFFSFQNAAVASQNQAFSVEKSIRLNFILEQLHESIITCKNRIDINSPNFAAFLGSALRSILSDVFTENCRHYLSCFASPSADPALSPQDRLPFFANVPDRLLHKLTSQTAFTKRRSSLPQLASMAGFGLPQAPSGYRYQVRQPAMASASAAAAEPPWQAVRLVRSAATIDEPLATINKESRALFDTNWYKFTETGWAKKPNSDAELATCEKPFIFTEASRSPHLLSRAIFRLSSEFIQYLPEYNFWESHVDFQIQFAKDTFTRIPVFFINGIPFEKNIPFKEMQIRHYQENSFRGVAKYIFDNATQAYFAYITKILQIKFRLTTLAFSSSGFWNVSWDGVSNNCYWTCWLVVPYCSLYTLDTEYPFRDTGEIVSSEDMILKIKLEYDVSITSWNNQLRVNNILVSIISNQEPIKIRLDELSKVEEIKEAFQTIKIQLLKRQAALPKAEAYSEYIEYAHMLKALLTQMMDTIKCPLHLLSEKKAYKDQLETHIEKYIIQQHAIAEVDQIQFWQKCNLYFLPEFWI